jgi:hypothetical protein
LQELEECTPRGELYRIGRCPDVWTPPQIRADKDPPHRFDDPHKTYRVLYASTERLGCFVEVLAGFRRPIGSEASVLRDLAAIKGKDDFLPPGYVPLSWFDGRCIGRATSIGRFADIYAANWIGYLGKALAPQALRLGVTFLDAAVLQRDQPRTLTQAASAEAKRLGYNGIYYRSRFGHNIDNWAIFEPFSGSYLPEMSSRLQDADPDFQAALKIHKLGIYDSRFRHATQLPPE